MTTGESIVGEIADYVSRYFQVRTATGSACAWALEHEHDFAARIDTAIAETLQQSIRIALRDKMQAIAEEREACAKVAASHRLGYCGKHADHIAAAIRARKEIT